MNFEDLIAKVKTCGKQKLAVAAAEDDAVLEAVDAAHKQGIADAILVGDEAAIRKIAAELNIDLSDYEIINEPDKVQASLKAVKLAHDGVANMYMKGLLTPRPSSRACWTRKSVCAPAIRCLMWLCLRSRALSSCCS